MLLAHHMKDKNSLLEKRRVIVSRLTGQAKVIRGTLVLMKRVCGNKRCKCSRGQKHESFYLSQSRQGRTQMIYLPRVAENKVREYTLRWRQLKGLLNQISEINLKLLSKGLL